MEISSYDDRDRLETSGSASFAWDEDGRLLSRSGEGGYALSWDSQDRLEEIAYSDGSRLESFYDVDGVQVGARETPAAGAGAETTLLTSKERPLSHRVAEIDGQSGAMSARYIRAADLLLAVFRGAERRYYHGDPLGSVRQLSDPSGAVTDQYEYFAFGALRSHAGSDENPYLFAGEPYDPKDLLGYHRERWLDPRSGRFTSLDPAAGPAPTLARMQRYAYAESNPVTLADPTGRSPCRRSTTEWGDRVEEVIGSDFLASTNKRYFDTPLSSALPSVHWGADGGLKPDLLDATAREFYEIKSIYSAGIGEAKVALYLAVLTYRDPFWLPGMSYRPPKRIDLDAPPLYAYVFPPVLGLITYCVLDWDLLKATAAFAAITGTSILVALTAITALQGAAGQAR